MERKTKGGRGPGGIEEGLKEVQYGMNYGRKEEGRKVKSKAIGSVSRHFLT